MLGLGLLVGVLSLQKKFGLNYGQLGFTTTESLRYKQMVGGCGAYSKIEGGEYSMAAIGQGNCLHRTLVLTRLISRSQLKSNKLTENP